MTHFVDEFSSCVVYNYPFVQRSYCIYHSVNSLPQYEFVHVFFGWYLIWMLFHNNCKHIFSLENVISHVSSKHLCPWILTHINDKERVSGHYGLSWCLCKLFLHLQAKLHSVHMYIFSAVKWAYLLCFCIFFLEKNFLSQSGHWTFFSVAEWLLTCSMKLSFNFVVNPHSSQVNIVFSVW